jgi:hypothetical protein
MLTISSTSAVFKEPDLFGHPRDPSSIVGMIVRLERTHPCHCGSGLAVIGSSIGQHWNALRCPSCRLHRGYLPATVSAFLTETVRVFGAPAEPPIIKHERSTMMSTADKPKAGYGSLRRVEQTNPKGPSHKGTCVIEGRKLTVAAWVREDEKSGKKYFTLSFEHEAPPRGGAPATAPSTTEPDDGVPF